MLPHGHSQSLSGFTRILKVGHRTTGDWRHRDRTAGWEYVHVAIEDCSRVAYAQIAPEEDTNCTVAFLRYGGRFLRWAWRADQGSLNRQCLSYRSRDFPATCAALGLTHHYTPALYTANQWQRRCQPWEIARSCRTRPTRPRGLVAN